MTMADSEPPPPEPFPVSTFALDGRPVCASCKASLKNGNRVVEIKKPGVENKRALLCWNCFTSQKTYSAARAFIYFDGKMWHFANDRASRNAKKLDRAMKRSRKMKRP